MKILNIENNTKKLHIQKQDLVLLEQLYTGIILSTSLFSHLDNDKDLNTFITIKNEHDIELINTINFILDYRHYRAMKINDLKLEIKRIKEKNINKDIKKHIIKQLQQIIDLKTNSSSLELPKEIDQFAYHHTGIDNKNKYVVSTGLNPNYFFFHKKNNEPLTILDTIPHQFIEDAIRINILHRSNQDEIIKIQDEIYTTTPDLKFLIIEIKPEALTKDKGLIKTIKRNLHSK